MTRAKHERPDEPETSNASGSSDADERAWVHRVRAGDSEAFEALFRAYWQPLYAFAFRYVQSKEEAEEVVQTVFLRIWRGRAEWRLTGSVRSYLYAAVRNAAHDRLSRAAVVEKWRQHEARAHAPPSAPGTAQIEAQLQYAELTAAVERALAELPARRRAVCTLRLIDGLSYAQIAERLGITEKTVETQLSRGLKFLRERFRHLHHSTLTVAVTLLRIVS